MQINSKVLNDTFYSVSWEIWEVPLKKFTQLFIACVDNQP